ncbi:MAG: glutamyl-tRNA reductase [Acidobacteria bacterium]|nr:glutamyl-tRNA reductase [Acidobacteriota bacterium]
MHVQLLGINHHTAPIELREALAMDGATVQAVLREIRSNGAVSEAVILATCNRTEFYVSAADAVSAEAAMRQMFVRQAGHRGSLVAPHAYLRSGDEACRHLLRVAAGLDSMILGEHQILGQVRGAQTLAQDAETLGPLMHRLWSTAIHTGRRARAETDIGMGAVSVASATVSLAERVLGDLRDRSVLLIGAGDTCRLAARHFADRRPARLVVANRTLARAAAVAEAFGGYAAPLGDVPSLLSSVDVVVSATRAPAFVVTCEMVRRAVAGRGARPLVLVDVAVPRDIEPSAASLDNVVLYPIDAVRTLVDRSLAHRLRQVPRVEAIVEEECGKLMAWTRGQGAASVVRELADRFERVRAEEVGRNLKHFHPDEKASIDRMTKTLINRLLRPPITQLTSGTLPPSVESARLELLRELFALEPAPSALGVGNGTS